jgi:hypothetical protein
LLSIGITISSAFFSSFLDFYSLSNYSVGRVFGMQRYGAYWLGLGDG